MIWQFGELGYDYSINYCEDGTINDDCRVAPKPIRWDYYDDPDRLRIYQVIAAINELNAIILRSKPLTSRWTPTAPASASTSTTPTWTWSSWATLTWWTSTWSSASRTPAPGTTSSPANPLVTDLNASFYYLPGDYAIYTDQPLPTPQVGVGIEEHAEAGAHLPSTQPQHRRNHLGLGAAANVRDP